MTAGNHEYASDSPRRGECSGTSPIAAFDGLRFIAAGTVLFSHGFFYLLLNQDNARITAYNAPFVGMANIGMTLSSC